MNLVLPLLRRFSDRMTRPALVCEDDAWDGSRCLDEYQKKLAGLKAAGCQSGDRVIVFSGRGNAFWCDLLAVWAAGGVVVPLVPALPTAHQQAVLDKAEPVLVMGTEYQIPASFSGIKRVENNAIDSKGVMTPAVLPPDATAGILFTSGSTGLPKGVQLSHRALLHNALATATMLPAQSGDTLFIAIPFRFVSAISHFLVTILTGGCFAGTESLTLPADLIARLKASGATAFGGAPIQLRWIGAQMDEAGLNLRWVMSSGDHLSPDIIEQFARTRARPFIMTVYGMTELAGRFCILPHELVSEKAGSVGYPIAGLEVDVRDDDSAPVPPGEIGGVYVRGVCVMDRYCNDPESTRAMIGADGWMNTGDHGVLDEEGYLYLKGRSDSVFKSSGLKVSGFLIADALMKTGEFTDVAVFPVADELAGHVARAYYCMEAGREFDRGRVLRALRQTLPANHLPREFIRLEKIPRTASGKIDRVAFHDVVQKVLKTIK